MRPEDLVAFAAGAAAVPLWQPLPAVSESNMPRHVGYVYNMLMVCKAAQQKRFSDLPTKQQEVFKANLLEFLEKNQFIAKGARTGADWPAAALAGLFAGAALQAVREQRRVAALKKNEEAQKYYNELSGTFYQKLAHPEDSNELCLPVVRLVVFFLCGRSIHRTSTCAGRGSMHWNPLWLRVAWRCCVLLMSGPVCKVQAVFWAAVDYKKAKVVWGGDHGCALCHPR